MLQNLALLLLVCFLSAYFAAKYAWSKASARNKRIFQAAQARWEREEAELRMGRAPPQRSKSLKHADQPGTSPSGRQSTDSIPTSRHVRASSSSGTPTRPAESSGGHEGPSSSSSAPIIMESFTLGWLNMVIQSMWGPVLERWVSRIATERLQLILNEVLKKVGDKKPWKFIEAVAVEGVTFGLSPPQFQFANVKYDPARQHLQIQLNLRYNSSGFQAVLMPRMRRIGALRPFSFRLEITHLLLAGRMNLGLQLSHEAPGIKGVEYSFLQEPEFEIQASPLGLSGLAGELPGLISSLRGALLKAMSKKIVEPNRKYLDMSKIYQAKFVAKGGGPGGMLHVTVIGARDITGATTGKHSKVGQSPPLPSASTAKASSKPSPTSGLSTDSNVDPFVEMKMGRETHRTPFVHSNATSPVWNWKFSCGLAGDIPHGQSDLSSATSSTAAAPSSSSQGGTVLVLKDDLLRFSVLNAVTIGEPELLCSCQIRLRDVGILPNGNAVPVLLPLLGLRGRPQGSLQVLIKWIKPISKPKVFSDVEVQHLPMKQELSHQRDKDGGTPPAASPEALQKPPRVVVPTPRHHQRMESTASTLTMGAPSTVANGSEATLVQRAADALSPPPSSQRRSALQSSSPVSTVASPCSVSSYFLASQEEISQPKDKAATASDVASARSAPSVSGVSMTSSKAVASKEPESPPPSDNIFSRIRQKFAKSHNGRVATRSTVGGDELGPMRSSVSVSTIPTSAFVRSFSHKVETPTREDPDQRIAGWGQTDAASPQYSTPPPRIQSKGHFSFHNRKRASSELPSSMVVRSPIKVAGVTHHPHHHHRNWLAAPTPRKRHASQPENAVDTAGMDVLAASCSDPPPTDRAEASSLTAVLAPARSVPSTPVSPMGNLDNVNLSKAGHSGALTGTAVIALNPLWDGLPQAGADEGHKGESGAALSFDPFQSLSQVMRMQAALEQERAEARELSEKLQSLQREYHALSRLRQLEARRALMEGARFLMFRSTWPSPRVICLQYSEPLKALRIVAAAFEELITHEGRSDSALAGSKGGEIIVSVPTSSISAVELGLGSFPRGVVEAMAAAATRSEGGKLAVRFNSLIKGIKRKPTSGGGSSPPRQTLQESKCFSIIIATPASGEGDLKEGHSDGLNLMVPLAGNGRSRDEWVHGITELMEDMGLEDY